MHRFYCPSLTPSEIVLFEELLCKTFEEINVWSLLEENIKKRDSRALSVKLDLDGDDSESNMKRGKQAKFVSRLTR